MDSETAAIVVSIVTTGIGIVTLTGLMARMLWTSIGRQFDAMNNSMARQFEAVNSRLQHIENRIDDTNKRIDVIGRDIADLRDRTGTLEGTLSTFMNEGRSPNAA